MTESGPVQGQGSSHFLETPSVIFEAKGEVGSGIHSEGGIEPSDPIKRSRDPHDNSLPPADPYRMRHELPLEFPATSSPEIVRTHPSGVVRRSRPSSLLKRCVRVVRLKTSRTLIQPHAHKAWGHAHHKLASTKEDQTRHGGSSTRASLNITY
jgi:hypothetical protein